MSRVSFERAPSGGYTSVRFDGDEVAMVGRGGGRSVAVTVLDNAKAAPIREIDGQRFRHLRDAREALQGAYEEKWLLEVEKVAEKIGEDYEDGISRQVWLDLWEDGFSPEDAVEAMYYTEVE